ncbi:hypothetical protein GGI03_003652 [Coemansia sp. RSA 2337]|nr:hypothetical protein H4S03_006317 [Coemansia sp. S3946]KAJ2072128.1 hypothetical protein GGH13_002895 [Coemansia sp. S155-1]KAJ2115446.1 hypothetical protein IW146_002305 [Coemansia sp. RSA 922]KAJ2348935.1 hypothetical protein GGH92_002678 [Coemansia sp. RSA 2673]KAJ2463738.1 hypothetical protein GGI03_003652 [Coemansia sp. RSA 2337]
MADVKFGSRTVTGIQTCQGLWQGDPLLPLLYNHIAKPLICYLCKHIVGIKLPGYTLFAIALADDITVALSSDDDVTAFRNAIELHSHASNAKSNNDKPERLHIDSTTLAPSGIQILPDCAVTRYLGIYFSKDGIATGHMEGQYDVITQPKAGQPRIPTL